TSLTVEGITDVVDSGWHKVLRYDAARGLDRLETERIGLDSADQRAGRAGRTGPGRALRLWDPRERLRAPPAPDLPRVGPAAAGPARAGLPPGGPRGAGPRGPGLGRRSAGIRMVRDAARGRARCRPRAAVAAASGGGAAPHASGRSDATAAAAPPAGPGAARR